jgi:protein-disulfide isomerase
VRLVVKQLPFRSEPESVMAAVAALAARDQGRFREMHEMLLRRSPRLDRESLVLYAGELHLDTERFARDIDGLRNLPEVENDRRLAKSLGVDGTPAFLVNGSRVVGALPYEDFKALVEEKLRSAEAGR